MLDSPETQLEIMHKDGLDTPDLNGAPFPPDPDKIDLIVRWNTAQSLDYSRCLDMAKIVTPHLVLLLMTATYVLFGALVFQNLERDHFTGVVNDHKRAIETETSNYLEQLWQATRKEGASRRSIEEESEAVFDRYVDTVYGAYRTTKRRTREEPSTIWDFKTAIFFTTSMLTSIGYGFIVPTTFYGRLFCVAYCLLGIPLTLVTVANIAKFCSECMYWLFRHYHNLRLYIRKRHRLAKNAEETESILNFDDLEDNLEKIQLYRFPVLLVFVVVFGYGLCGVYLLGQWEGWTATEALYFSLISIFTVGLGDLKPEHGTYMRILLFTLAGVVLTTMCMDILGSMYLEEIHNVGRQIQNRNPFYLLREAKMRRRRAAMAGLLAQLAKGLALQPPSQNTEDLMKKHKKKKKKRRIRRQTCADTQPFFQRSPPDKPGDCQVISTSAYSARLAWSPAFPSVGVTYNVRYKLKHDTSSSALDVQGITACAYEITHLKSCSLYEFTITAVNRFGSSAPVHLVQYTEFELSPQHIVAEKLSANSVRLSWEPPFKRIGRIGIKQYVIYHTDDTKASLDLWKKVTIDSSRSVLFPGLKYDCYYMFCVRAVFRDNTPSPLSRAILIRTDKLQFNQRCIGMSKTVEFMEGLHDCQQSTQKHSCTHETTRELYYNTL